MRNPEKSALNRRHDLIDEQRALNRATADNQALFEGHRTRLMSLIEESGGSGRLALVGAGNCNDYDLPRLVSRFAHVELIDVDAEAVEGAAFRQGVAGEVAIRAPCDVGNVGIAHDALEAGASFPDVLEALARGTVPVDPNGFDLVVSAGVLTQAMRAVAGVLGENDARIGDLAVAVRSGHIRTLLGMARPGGRVLLVTEVVSNQVLPEVADARESELGAILFRAIFRGDVFTGVSPAAITSWLGSERPFGARLVTPGIFGPWRWRQSPARTFLMVAFLMERPA
jgi:hypothetical protein